MNLELIGALKDLEKERGISKEILLEAIETAIVSAYKRNYGASSSSSVKVEFNQNSGQMHVYSLRTVVAEIEDPTAEISLEEAQKIDPNYELGHVVEQEVTPTDFGRIAAQTAKQVVIQKIREAERTLVYELYANREGDVVQGTVLRADYRQAMVDLGDVEAVLPYSEQIPNEVYKHNARYRFYISEVRQSSKGPQVFLSRTHPGLLKALFEMEVPEIQSGEVEIKSVAREAGNRSKLAVYSRDPNIDPIGACVGARGVRVQAVVSELGNERIDIVEWVNNLQDFIKNALSPAKVLFVRLDEENKVAYTVVPDDQLSLAIGKEGQNARLAARLTGWKIDIKNLEQAEELFGPEPEKAVEETVPEEELTADESAHAEKPAVGPVPEISEEELAALTNVVKRKSWQERFGLEEETSEVAESQKKQDSAKEERKKKEKVITDFSQLDSIDFDFKEKE
ncbi:MAG: transcription termination/antitermination protein NusA [Firmicutes bacterium]|nr:transcription termination/antitermination protein NusA [Bacillota bacterium]